MTDLPQILKVDIIIVHKLEPVDVIKATFQGHNAPTRPVLSSVNGALSLKDS